VAVRPDEVRTVPADLIQQSNRRNFIEVAQALDNFFPSIFTSEVYAVLSDLSWTFSELDRAISLGKYTVTPFISKRRIGFHSQL
jgi:hypothetical protein